MTKRPLCMVCLVLMLLMCVADRAGFPLIRGNPVPENVDSWIREHPKVTICGEVTQTTENEFSQSVYLSNTYLIYQPKKNQSKENQPKKISIENVKVFLKKKEDVPAGTVVLCLEIWREWVRCEIQENLMPDSIMPASIFSIL